MRYFTKSSNDYTRISGEIINCLTGKKYFDNGTYVDDNQSSLTLDNDLAYYEFETNVVYLYTNVLSKNYLENTISHLVDKYKIVFSEYRFNHPEFCENGSIAYSSIILKNKQKNYIYVEDTKVCQKLNVRILPLSTNVLELVQCYSEYNEAKFIKSIVSIIHDTNSIFTMEDNSYTENLFTIDKLFMSKNLIEKSLFNPIYFSRFTGLNLHLVMKGRKLDVRYNNNKAQTRCAELHKVKYSMSNNVVNHKICKSCKIPLVDISCGNKCIYCDYGIHKASKNTNTIDDYNKLIKLEYEVDIFKACNGKKIQILADGIYQMGDYIFAPQQKMNKLLSRYIDLEKYKFVIIHQI